MVSCRGNPYHLPDYEASFVRLTDWLSTIKLDQCNLLLNLSTRIFNRADCHTGDGEPWHNHRIINPSKPNGKKKLYKDLLHYHRFVYLHFYILTSYITHIYLIRFTREGYYSALSQMYPYWNWTSKLNTKLRLEFQVEYGFK